MPKVSNHKCNEGWICSEHEDKAEGHIVKPWIQCEAPGKLCDDVDCKASRYEIEGCMHFWTISLAKSALSKGICEICGEERKFKNSFDKDYWKRTESK